MHSAYVDLLYYFIKLVHSILDPVDYSSHAVWQFSYNCLSANVLVLAIGFRQSRTSVGCPGLWFVALNGSDLRNRADFHPSGFLLLLCQKVG